MPGLIRRWLCHCGILGVLAGAVLPVAAHAHEIPQRVTATVYAVRDSGALRAWVRVPLAAMRDVDFPLRPDGTLRLALTDAAAREAAQLWIADLLSPTHDGRPLARPVIEAVRVALPSSTAFDALADIRTHFLLPQDTSAVDLPWTQAMLDVALVYRDVPPTGALAIAPRVARLGVETRTILHLTDRSAAERVLVVEGDPGVLPFTPSWLDAALRFVRMGIAHILDGIDHLLFLFCLVLPVRRLLPLVGTITAFTLAHSITLLGAALGFVPDVLWFPPFIEMLIAASIVVLAAENLLGARTERRWMLAFGFGLVHGFGFAFALRESLQFAGGHLLAALAAFNVGVELGQLGVLVVAVPVLALCWRLGVPERGGVMLASAFVAHEAWHWMTERWTAFRAVPLTWPTMDAAFGAALAQLALLGAIAWGVAWGLGGVLRRWSAPPSDGGSERVSQQAVPVVR